VRVFRLILVVAAALAAGGQFLEERRRLKVIERLPGREARDYYERTRARDERLMVAVTAVLAVAATAGVVATLVHGRGA